MSAKVFAYTEDSKGNCIEHAVNYEIKKNGKVFRLSFSGERVDESIFVKSLAMPTRYQANELGYKIATSMAVVIEQGNLKNYLLYAKQTVDGVSFKTPILRCELHLASAITIQLNKAMEILGANNEVTFGIKNLKNGDLLVSKIFD